MAIDKICKRCKSSDIKIATFAAWDVEQQVWDLDESFSDNNGAYCCKCQDFCQIKDKEFATT